jgi:hypothetical protein
MRQSHEVRRNAPRIAGLMVLSLLLVGAEGPKQTIEARGLSFQAPAAWKSSPPTSQMRLAQLKVDPTEGDDYPAEMVVYVFPGGAGSVDANLQRWQGMFKDKDGNRPKIDSKKVKGKNTEVTRAETSGDYHPAQFGGRPEPDRPDARLLGAIIMTDQASYYIRMIGPNKTMTKLRPDFDELLSTIKVEGQ